MGRHGERIHVNCTRCGLLKILLPCVYHRKIKSQSNFYCNSNCCNKGRKKTFDRRSWQRKYSKTDKRKAYVKKLRSSEKHQAWLKKFRSSDKQKERNRMRSKSEKYKKWRYRYSKTEKGKRHGITAQRKWLYGDLYEASLILSGIKSEISRRKRKIAKQQGELK